MSLLQKRLIISIVLLFTLLSFPLYIAYTHSNDEIVKLSEGPDYTAERIHNEMNELVEKYPNLLKVVKIGESLDKRDLLVLIMTDNIEDYTLKVKQLGLQDALKSIDKVEIFIESNLHGREIVSAPTTLKVIETYCQDYYNHNQDLEYDVDKILEKSVIHWLVLSNPDGFMISKFGRDGVKDPELRNLIPKSPKKYYRWKANANGVDLNRNFDSNYYDLEKRVWCNFWDYDTSKARALTTSTKPGPAYYRGEAPYTEPEVIAIRDYVLSHNFKKFLSVHNRGQIFYYDKVFMSKQYRDKAKKISADISNLSNYKPVDLDDDEEWDSMGRMNDGFFTDFTVGELNKFTITLEQVPQGASFPLNNLSYYTDGYEALKNLPLYLANVAIEEGDLPYKVYIDGKYYNDYQEEAYAKAAAEKFGGKVVYSKERANGFIAIMTDNNDINNSIVELLSEGVINEEDMNQYGKPITRLEMIRFIIRKLVMKKGIDIEFLSYNDLFKDTNDLYVNYAKYKKIVIEDIDDKNFHGCELVSREEFATVFVRFLLVYYNIYNGYQTSSKTLIKDQNDISDWSNSYVHYCVDSGILSLDSQERFSPESNILKQDLLHKLGCFHKYNISNLMK